MQLALTPDSRWDATLEEVVAAAAGAGFSNVSITGAAAGEAAAAVFARAGVGCHEVLGLLVTADEEKTLDAAAGLAEAAAVMGAPWALTIFGARPSADLVARAAAAIAEGGARMAVEFSPLGAVPSISAGLEVVAAAGPGRAGLMIDSWHFSHGPSTWEDLAALRPDQIAYVQFTDALPPESGNPAPESENLARECMHRRALPGEGTLELERFASTLAGTGWDGLVSVEVLSAELRRLPVAEAIRRAYETTARFWL